MPELVALNTMLPKIDSQYEVQAKGLQLRALQQADQQAQYQAQQQAQAQADDRAARAAYSANPTDAPARLSALAGVSPKAYSTEAKQQSDFAKADAEAKAQMIATAHKHIDLAAQAFGNVRNNPTPENALGAIQYLADNGVYTPQQAALYSDKVRQNPGAVKDMADQAFTAALSTKDQLPKIETRDTGGMVQTIGTNPLTGKVTTLSQMAKTVSPDTKYSADSSARTAARRLEYENQQPRGQIIQTDSGPMLVDPRGGTSRAVTGPDGQPLAPKMKSLPAPIQKALLENDAALRKVDAALSSIESYPEAFGMSNYMGDMIRQRTDPKGVKGRALVADIGSLKLHDRSGAAVTASETPRLKPFIPAATDDVATIKEKLGLFKQEYEAIQNDINSTYSQEQGYRVPTRTEKPATPSNVPDDIAALLKKHGGK